LGKVLFDLRNLFIIKIQAKKGRQKIYWGLSKSLNYSLKYYIFYVVKRFMDEWVRKVITNNKKCTFYYMVSKYFCN